MARKAIVQFVAEVEIPDIFEGQDEFKDSLADAIATGSMDVTVELYAEADEHEHEAEVKFIGFNANVEFLED